MELTPAETMFAAHLPTKKFSQLPKHVQEWLKKPKEEKELIN